MGGSSKPATQTSTTQMKLSPEQEKLFNLAMPLAEAHAGSPINTYQGPTVAGFTPEQLEAQKAYKVFGAAGQGLGEQAATSQNFMLGLDQLNPGSNPFLSQIADQITGKIQTGLVEKTLPIIRGSGIQAGGMYGGGSTRQQLAEGGAVTGAAEATGDALGKLYFDNYQAGINNIARAQQLNPSIQAQQLFGPGVLDAVGGQKQAMEQAFMTDDAQRFNLEQYAPFMRAQEIASLLQMMPNTASTVSTNVGAQPQKNKTKSALGGAASGAAMGASFGPVGMGIGGVLGGLGGFFG